MVGLLLPEAFCLFYSKHELFFQLLIALVRREVQTIKATMGKKKKTEQKQNDLYLSLPAVSSGLIFIQQIQK